ncbi:histone-lysine N-methyltransferase SUV39H2-like [Rhopalosiphum maidis]|uniref:histone-lysine N-methyltransferase SUV39H2-like n=1 Tax=Rhopalosiphum maidis TaxID=43146 RepID=UPI000F000EE5|nr:histone-lysine N-methyltransferase SUV39H2-like [Rhopalosiphum maidis]XP_026818904.1 histone-lysine N-methyltransferase SUV39H2-like [Rhopalosiphum maidis]
MSDNLSRNSDDNDPSIWSITTRNSSSPEIISCSIKDLDSKNVKILETTSSNQQNNLESDSNDSHLSGVTVINCTEENLDNIDATISSAEKSLKTVDEYPDNLKSPLLQNDYLLNNAKPMSKVVGNGDSNEDEKSRAEKNSIQNETETVSSHLINNNDSSSRMEIDDDINIVSTVNSNNESDVSLNVTSKTNVITSTPTTGKRKMKSLLSSNSHRDRKSLRTSEPVFQNTAFIIVPSIIEKVDQTYSYIVSDSRIQNFIKEGKMMLDDNILDAYDPTEIDEIIKDEIILGTRYYLVKWKKWSRGFNTWERYGALYKSQKLLLKYIQSKKNYKRVNSFQHSIDGTLLMMSRKIISHLFETFRTESGLSLPSYLPEDMSGLFNCLDVGSINAQKYKNVCFQWFLSVITVGYLRQQQLVKLKQWEIDINVVTQGYKIKVENNMDLEGPPDSFVYINQYVPQATITIPDDPPIGCICKKNCQYPEECCYEMSGCLKAYDKHKNIIVTPGNPVFECNKKCKCSSSCSNRVVQLGSKVNVCIYKTRKYGWGVKSTQNIQKGQFVGKYIGEIITVEESEQRLRNGSSLSEYMWSLDFDDSQNYKYTIDGTHYANFTYFINHSCNANLNVYAVWINCLDRNLPQLALFASRDISAGEQLTTNYFFRSNKNSLKKSGTRCQCDMKNCQGYYF